MIKLYLQLLYITRALQSSWSIVVNAAPKLQLVKRSLINEITRNENNHRSSCAGNIIYLQAYLLLTKYEFSLQYTKMN